MRLDRWLWTARIHRTRTLASQAVLGGKIKLNGRRGKPASAVAVGDRIHVRRGPFELDLIVRALAERRGSPTEAQTLYEETLASRQARELHASRLRLAATPAYDGKGRPTKRERRALDRLRREPDEG